MDYEETAQRREVHEQLLAEVELSAKGNREHQLLLLLWQRVLASPFMGKQWLLHLFEWFVREGQPHLGVGDAVFVDEAGRCALVLELKLLHEGTGHTAQVARTAARSKVKEKAEKYADSFAQQNPDMEVLAATCCERLDDVLKRGKVPEIECWPLESSPVPCTPLAITAMPEVLPQGRQIFEAMGSVHGTKAGRLLAAGAALVATASIADLAHKIISSSVSSHTAAFKPAQCPPTESSAGTAVHCNGNCQMDYEEMAHRREVHEQLLAEVELSARGNREHQLLLLLWQMVLATSRVMGKRWLLHRFEWFVREGQPHLGVGDAVFVDEAGRCALVLELKLLHEGTGHTAKVARTAARSYVKEQAEKYAAIFAQQNPGMEVVAATCCERLDDVLNRGKVPEIECWPLASSIESSPVPRTPLATTATPEVLEGNTANANYGYNAANDQYGDLMEVGIIDPTKVVRCTLENAVSVAKTFLLADVVVTEIPEHEPAAAGAGGGDEYGM